jgi:4-aminobutyrate aminotransferase-like enzyme
MASPVKTVAATAGCSNFYQQTVNPQWLALLNLLDMNVEYGLATLDMLERENLGPRAQELGKQFRADLRQALAPFGLVKEVRGLGLLSGIEFRTPRSCRCGRCMRLSSHSSCDVRSDHGDENVSR